jgi:hypothetical protein
MDNERYLNSAFWFKLFFSAIFCACGWGSVVAQSFDSSIFVINNQVNPPVVTQAWNATPVRFVVEDVFYSTALGRYLGQNGPESFAATANLMSGGQVIYQENLGNLTFSQSGFSFVIGSANVLMPVVLTSPNITLRLDLPSQTATFAITSVPYAIHSRVAERGLAGSASVVSGNFVSTFSVQTGLVTSQNTLVVRGSRVGVGTFSPAYTLDVSGIANFSDMYLQGRPLTESLSWRESTLDPNNIYTIKKPVGIRTAFPSTAFALHVAATVNATNLTRNGNPISASNFWVQTSVPTYNLYILDHNVAIGRSVPQARLDVNGGVRLDTTSSGNTGTLRWAAVDAIKDFQGYVDAMDGTVPTQTWRSLTGISGSGREDRVARWLGAVSPPNLDYVADLVHKSGIGLGIGVSPTSRLHVSARSQDSLPVLLAASAANIPIFQISPTGGVGIGTSVAGNRVEVVGTLNATDLLIHGVPLRLTLSSGTYWLRNQSNDLYYLQGNVGIGRPDPSSLFEIAAPNRAVGEPTKNPSITFTAKYGTVDQQRYTLGINAQEDGVFRVEKGLVLGSETPLFVAFDDRFGIGLSKPQANLHVSGNLGLILTGLYEALNPGVSALTSTVSVTGPGTRMLYHPSKGVFRVGYLSGTDVYSGSQWDNDNLGIVSTAFGQDHIVSGNFSNAIGGDAHRVGGAYATVVGGRGNQAYGDFAVALGRGAMANHHGSFVWADSVGGDFKTATENQFLIRSSAGVGINSYQTGLFVQSSTKNVALTVYPKPVGAVHFLGILPDSTDWGSAQAVVDELITQGYLLSSGEMAPNFNPLAALTFSPGFAYADLESQIRSVLSLHSQGYVLDFKGVNGQSFVYTQQGGFGVNTTTPSSNAVAVLLPVFVNASGNAHLSVQGTSKQEPLFLTVGTENPISSPSFVVVASGNVGIGKFPDLLANGNPVSGSVPVYGYLESVGSIVANGFVFPDGQGLSASESVIVWAFANTTPNIYFPSANVDSNGRLTKVGNVGIGTSSPNSLLEISNRSSVLGFSGVVSPVITFDLDATDRYTMGVSHTDSDVFRIGSGDAGDLAPGSAFSVLNNRVGIAITRPLSAALSVGGNTMMSRLKIGTANMGATTNLAVKSVNSTQFVVNNELIGWLSVNRSDNTTDIFHDTAYSPDSDPPIYSFVGIGTSEPLYALDVVGTLNVVATASTTPALVMQNLIVDGDYYAYELNFRDAPAGSEPSLMVTNQELILDPHTGTVNINISKVFTRGEGAGGYVGMWSTDPGVPSFSVLAPTNMYWTSPTADAAGILLVTANTMVRKYIAYSDSFSASNNINFGSAELANMVTAKSVISHDGVLAHSRSHDAVSMNVLIQTWPGATIDEGVDWLSFPATPIPLTGLSIRMRNVPYANAPTYFSGGARAIGLNVDVSAVNLQQFTDEGYRFPAIFMGASNAVGIGGTPNATLDVYGTLRAQTFQISNGLSITTINVLNAIYVDQPRLVGFGTTLPTRELDLAGSIQSIGMIAPVNAKSLSAGGGNLTVGTNGYVGMGTSAPVAQWELRKQFQSLPSSDFTFQTIDVTVSDNLNTQPLVGIQVTLSTVSGNNYANRLGDLFNAKQVVGTGYKLDLSGLSVPTGGVVVGLSSIVSADRTIDRKAAIFLGGNVGIGTTMPAYPLEVVGTIYATNAPAANFLTEQEVASFSMLNVANGVLIKEDGQFWDVSVNTLKQQELRLLGTLSIPNQSLIVQSQMLVQGLVSINETVTVNTVYSPGLVSLQTASVNKMAVGGALTSAALKVYGTLSPSEMVLTSGNLESLNLSVNESSLVFTNGRVGIGTSTPSTRLHLKTEPYQLNGSAALMDPADYRTWNPMVLQAAAAVSGDAVGLVFVPDYDTSGRSGSGVVAVKTSDTTTASALAFVTDPEGEEAYPQERLRITDAGWVGIGTTTPAALLDVGGTLLATNMTFPTASLSVLSMSGATVTFSITTNVSALAQLDRLRVAHVDMVPTGMPVVSSDNGKLFVDSATQQLFYAIEKNGDSIVGNLTVTNSVLSDGEVSYFDSTRSLSGVSLMRWVTENTVGRLQISSGNSASYAPGSRFLVTGFVSQNVAASRALQTINLGFKDRSTPGTARFSAMDIVMDGAVPFHSDDRLVGLSVSVSDNLRTQTTLPNGTIVSGSVVAAAFLVGTESSGNISISSGAESEINLIPSAAVHVLAKRTNHTPVWVQTTVNAVLVDAWLVSANTDVGIGTSLPTSRLSVRSQSSSDAGLRLANASGGSVFSVTDAGVGIGLSQPSHALSVSGLVSANRSVFGGILGTALVVNTANSGLSVSSVGEVMIGTTAPLGQFTMKRHFTTPQSVPIDFFMEDISQTIGSGGVALEVTRNLTGLGVVVTTDAYSTFEGTAGSKLVTGIQLDLKHLVANTGNRVVGTSVDMGLSASQGAGRYAAVFLGGNVGIGVTQPTVALDILGDIRGRNLIASGDWTLSSVTTNLLYGTDAVVTTFDIRSATPLSLEITRDFWIGASATVNIEGGQYDSNLFRTVALNAVFGTANRVIVGYDTSDIDVFDYVTQIATDFPTNPAFVVNGNGAIQSLTVPTVSVSQSISASTLAINSPMFITANRVTHSGTMSLGSLRMTPTASVSGRGLYVQSGVLNAPPLVFRPLDNATVTIDISSVTRGMANRVAGYNGDGRLSDAPFMQYTDTISSGVTVSVLSVVTNNAVFASGNSAVGLYSGYGTTTNLGAVSASKISVGVGPRVTGTSSVFSGLSIHALSAQTVGAGEVHGGLYLDMTDSLKDTTIFPNPDFSPAVGSKIAAIFRTGSQSSGNVGINTDETAVGPFWPSADLHVVSVAPDAPILVQTATRTAIGSGRNGYMSVGHAVPSASLSVVGYSDTEALSVIGGTTQVLVAGASGIGVGQAPNGAAWSVFGTTSANQAIIGELAATSMQIGTAVVVNNLGYVGIGTTTPLTSLEMAKVFALPADLSSDYRQRAVSVSIDTAINNNMHAPVSGYGISLGTDSQSEFGNGTLAVSAIGMSVDLKTMLVTANGRAQGVYSDVSGTGTRYSAVLMGGSVGIGTTTPTTLLDVAGTMTARHAVAISRVSANLTAATVNTLYVGSSGGATFSEMSVVAPGTDVFVRDTLRFANTSGVTVNFQDNLSTNKVWTSEGLIANVGTFNAMFIPSTPADWVVLPPLWVSANALFHNTVTLSPLMDSNLYVNTIVATQNLVLSDIRLPAGSSLNVTGYVSVGESAYLSVTANTIANTVDLGSSLALHGGNNALSIPTYRYPDRVIPLASLFNNYNGTPATFSMTVYGTDTILTPNVAMYVRPNTSSGNHIIMDSSMTATSVFSFQTIASVNTTVLATDYDANKVAMDFGDRSTAATNRFIGTRILLSGRVPLGDVAVGVSVNLTQLKSESSTRLPLNEDFAVDGFKSSAVFLADNNGDAQGTVGVFTFDHNNSSGYVTPNATLHVGNSATGNAGPFVVGTTATANTFIVTSLNAGIWVTPTDTQLRTTGLLVHATGTTNALRVANSGGASIMSALQSGSVGIGTTQAVASLNVVHSASTGYALWIDNPATSNPFVMSAAGLVGLGNTAPTSILDLSFDKPKYTFDVPIVWRVSKITDNNCNGDNNSGILRLTGRYLIGGASYRYDTQDTNCQTNLSTYSNDVEVNVSLLGLNPSTFPVTISGGSAPLRINAQTDLAMAMSQTGKVGIWRAGATENYIALSVSGSVMAGVDTLWIAPDLIDNPSTLQTYPLMNGYTVRQSGDFAFLGHYHQDSSVSANGVLMWGKDAGDALSFRDLNQSELLHFTKASSGGPRMGVATADPKATLSIGATAITQLPFRVDSSETANVLFLDVAGNVGIGGPLVPSKNLHVLGDFNIGQSNLGGLTAGTVTTNRLALETLGLGVLYETAPGFKGTLPIHQVSMSLAAYASKNITGVSYVLTSGNAYTKALVDTNAAAVKVTGLLVDVRNLATEEYSGNTSGYKASAVFMGGTVLVGYNASTNLISTASIPLEVYAMDRDGKSVSTGNVLQIETRDQNNAPLNVVINYMGNQNLYHEVSPLAFTAIRGIDDDASAQMMDAAIAQNDLHPTRAATVYAAHNVTTTNVVAADIIRQARVKATAVFHVQRDPGTGSDSMIQFLSGYNAATVTTSMVSTVGVGHIGFGLTSSNVDLAAIDRPLVVSGNVGVGVTSNSFFLGSAGWGAKVHFSGGRVYAPGANNDNTHEYFMGRYNSTDVLSELRLNIGETSTTSPNPSSKLIIDSYPVGGNVATNLRNWGASGSLATGFSVSVFGYVDPSDATLKTDLPLHAGVGIGTTTPAAGLHVVGRTLPVAGPLKPTGNTVLFASSGNQNLALVNYGTGVDANLMTFIHKDTTQTGVPGYAPTILGAIERDGVGGVQFASPEADYAEYLPKRGKEVLQPGDVVGIFDGQVSLKTSGARSVRIMSSRPIVAGNFPGEDQLNSFGLVAFMGQVSVRVRGPVRAGDYLIPSGRQDGTAVAIVASSVVQPEQIIGQAWESSTATGESRVKAVVGLSFTQKHVGERLGEVTALQAQLTTAQSDLEKLERYLKTKYEEREAKIALLRKR